MQWLRQLPLIYTARVAKDANGTRLEWVVGSDCRFFPTLAGEIFGYVLHPVDLAVNKAMAAAGRRELRDLIDLVTVHETILPLGAVVWAAVEKSPVFTPEGLRMPTSQAGLLFLKDDAVVARSRASGAVSNACGTQARAVADEPGDRRRHV